MAVVSARSDLKIGNGLGSFREWVATAASQDTAAGQSVVVTIAQTASTVPAPPNVADTLTLEVYVDAGATLLRSFTLTPGSASQTVALFVTSDGTSGGSPRAGTLRMTVHAINTTGGAAGTYNCDTDLTNNTPPTGDTVQTHDQGWVRGTTSATTTLPSAGTLAYGDTLTATTVLGAAPLDSRTVKVALGSVVAATTSAASSAATFTTALGTVDNRFPVVASNQTTATTFPNATLTGLPWTTATPTETTRSVDPRLSVTHYMQISDQSWTPPTTNFTDANHNVTSRPTSATGFVAHQLANANGVGQNGITFTRNLVNNQFASEVGYNDTGKVTQNEGAAVAGWGPDFGLWTSALDSGSWTDTVTITAPAGATGLEVGKTATFTLVAPLSSNVRAVIFIQSDQYAIDLTVPIRTAVRERQPDGSVKTWMFDSGPTIRVFRINSDGTETDALTDTVGIPIGTTAHQAVWTPSSTSEFNLPHVVEVRGVFRGSGMEMSIPFV